MSIERNRSSHDLPVMEANAAGGVVDPADNCRHKRHMETGRHRDEAFGMRRLAGMVLLCALLLRGMIPGGYMPDFGTGEGAGFLVVCSGAGGLTIVDPDGGQAPADTHQDGLCAFALLVNALPLLAAIVLLLGLLPRNILYRLPCIALGSRRLACALPAARAPPALA